MFTGKDFFIGELPFYYSPIRTPKNPDGIPDQLPFAIENRNGILSQVKSRETEDALKKAYALGSMISGQMDDFGNGKEYADEFLKWMSGNTQSFQGKRVLEIGCGTGYLLGELKKGGASVIGVEPGESAVYGQAKYGVEIRREFFDANHFEEKFDFIIFYGVLEHIYDIEDFLQNVRALLNERGIIFLAVPNCEEQIANGDISMFFTEHWSYFTSESLEQCLANNGLDGKVSASKRGGVLFANARISRKQSQAEGKSLRSSDCNTFIAKYQTNKKKMSAFFRNNEFVGGELGIYVPGRIVNWLGVVGGRFSRNNLRFIDDNTILRGTFFPGFEHPIETLEEFMTHPTERVLIASYTYADIIESKLRKCGYKGEVAKLQDILSCDGIY